jgi:hypothetical protein
MRAAGTDWAGIAEAAMTLHFIPYATQRLQNVMQTSFARARPSAAPSNE